MTRAMPGAFRALAADPDVRVIVVRGAGDAAFASGADLAEQQSRAGSGERTPARADAMFSGIGADAVLGCHTPVIAMITGWCMGGGLLLALCADLRVAARTSVFAIPAAKLGLAYPIEAAEMLVHVCGPGAAAELLFTGDRVDAERASAMGLVDILVEPADLEGRVRALAGSIAERAPLSIAAAKASIRLASGGRYAPDRATVVAAIEAAWDSDDAREGVAAFAEKRSPRFAGR